MQDYARTLWRWLGRTPVMTFILCPLAVIAFELALHGGRLTIVPWGAPLMAWGYLQYKLVGRYRIGRGGGGPGMKTLPDRLVTEGPYGWTRNPMYLGHVIFMIGVAVLFQSWLGAALAVARTIWFHLRVLRDERGLAERFGEPYVTYTRRVKRWVPGCF